MKTKKWIGFCVIFLGIGRMSFASNFDCSDFYDLNKFNRSKIISEAEVEKKNKKQLETYVTGLMTILTDLIRNKIGSERQNIYRTQDLYELEKLESRLDQIRPELVFVTSTQQVEKQLFEIGKIFDKARNYLNMNSRKKLFELTLEMSVTNPNFRVPNFVISIAKNSVSVRSLVRLLQDKDSSSIDPLAAKIVDLDITNTLKNIEYRQEKIVDELKNYLERAKSYGFFEKGREKNRLLDALLIPLMSTSYSVQGRFNLFIQRLLEKDRRIPNALRLPVKDILSIVSIIEKGIKEGAFFDSENLRLLYHVVNLADAYTTDSRGDNTGLKLSSYDKNMLSRSAIELDKALEYQAEIIYYVNKREEKGKSQLQKPLVKKTKEELLEEAKAVNFRKELEDQMRAEKEREIERRRIADRIAEEARRKEALERENRLVKEKRDKLIRILARKESPEATPHLADIIGFNLLKQMSKSGELKWIVSFGNMEDKGIYFNSGNELLAKLKLQNKRILIDADTVFGRELLKGPPDPRLVFVSQSHIEGVQSGHQMFVIGNDYLRMEVFGSSQMLATPSSAAAIGVYTSNGKVKFLADANYDVGFSKWSRELSHKGLNLGVTSYGFDRFRSISEMIKEVEDRYSSMSYQGFGFFSKESSNKVEESKSQEDIRPIDLGEFLQNQDSRALTSMIEHSIDFADAIKGMRKDPGGAVVFGSAKNDAKFTRLVWETSYELGKRGITIATGGSGGFMEVANDAAFSAGSHSVGIPMGGRMRLDTERETKTSIQTLTVSASGYEQRIPFLLDNRQLIVIAPGGSGTMRELGTAFLALMKEDRKNDALVLVSKDYYGILYESLKASELPESLRNRIFLVDNKEDMAQLADAAIETSTNPKRLKMSSTPTPRNSNTSFRGLPYQSEHGFFQSFRGESLSDKSDDSQQPGTVNPTSGGKSPSVGSGFEEADKKKKGVKPQLPSKRIWFFGILDGSKSESGQNYNPNSSYKDPKK